MAALYDWLLAYGADKLTGLVLVIVYLRQSLYVYCLWLLPVLD